ncbi:MAG TPA: hypothetical protein VNZ05_02225 [Solirubrobacteraceae bacterium]|nr:hypothetical protein [Solirubrobacteraceae bacterium]
MDPPTGSRAPAPSRAQAVGAVVIAVATLLCWLAGATPASASGVSVFTSATTGVLTPSRGSGLQVALTAAGRSRGVVHRHRGALALGGRPAAPSVASDALLAGPAAGLLANFNGVSSRDSALTNFGQEFEPPDQGLCAGNGFVLEMVNSAYTVYTPGGRLLTGPFNINGPFNLGLGEFTSDPRCYYDAADNTWFATILFINREETAGAIEVAVNTSGDPTKLWTDYSLETTDTGGGAGPSHPGCPCFGDQPTLGIDSHNLYVTTDEFTLAGEQENGAQIYAISKRDLVSLARSVHFVHFDNLSLGGALAGTVQPALSSGSPTAEYFLSSLDPSLTFGERVGVWALTKAAVVSKGGIPTLSATVLGSERYAVPPPPQQRSSPSPLEPGDDRMQQVQFTGGAAWGELATGLTPSGDSGERSGAAWFEVAPALARGVIGPATHIAAQGYLAVSGEYLLYPALALTPSGAGAMVMTLSGKKQHPSAAYATLAPGASSFGPVTLAAAGKGAYSESGERWGDYSWAVADPAGSSVWLATEYVPPKASQTPDGLRNWGTRVLDVPTG